MICTVTGCTERAGVGEFELGTPLSEVISTLGGPPRGKQIVAVLSGTANAFLPADLLDVPLSWEGLASVGSGLGSAGFIVIDDTVRTEERRVGKECVSTCRSRWSRLH